MNYFLPLKKSKDAGKYLFASVHRRENLEPSVLKEIIAGFKEIGETIYLPLHPHTRRILKKHRIKIPKNVEVVKPQPRKKTLERIFNSKLVMTDSGGILREAYWMGKHTLILRNVTEWEEIVSNGWATLVPPNAKRIAEAAKAEYEHRVMPDIARHNPYAEVKKYINA